MFPHTFFSSFYIETVKTTRITRLIYISLIFFVYKRFPFSSFSSHATRGYSLKRTQPSCCLTSFFVFRITLFFFTSVDSEHRHWPPSWLQSVTNASRCLPFVLASRQRAPEDLKMKSRTRVSRQCRCRFPASPFCPFLSVSNTRWR